MLDAMTFRDHPWLLDAATHAAAGLEGQKGVSAVGTVIEETTRTWAVEILKDEVSNGADFFFF